MREYVPGDSEQFQVEYGISSTSLMTIVPEIAGAGVPGTAGGTLGAHPWPLMLEAETERVVMLKKSNITRATTTKCRTSPPSSLFFVSSVERIRHEERTATSELEGALSKGTYILPRDYVRGLSVQYGVPLLYYFRQV
jgi:hypothetical protein